MKTDKNKHLLDRLSTIFSELKEESRRWNINSQQYQIITTLILRLWADIIKLIEMEPNFIKNRVPRMRNPPPPPRRHIKLQVKTEKTPHKCPVCNGNGMVPNGFYHQNKGEWITSSIEPETCQSCKGSGIVWG